MLKVFDSNIGEDKKIRGGMYLTTILDHRPSTVLEPLTLKVGSLEEGTLRTSQAYLSKDLVTKRDRSHIPKNKSSGQIFGRHTNNFKNREIQYISKLEK